MSSNKDCEWGIDCNKCKSRGMCTSYANHMYSMGLIQGKADAIEELNATEKNIPYSDFARGFRSGYEKGQIIITEHDAKVREEAIEEVLTLINEITTFYCGDKEGNAITPKMIVKDEVIKVIEQLKEKHNG